MIHSEIIESNRWRTQKNPDENPKYSILSIHQLKIKNILLEVYINGIIVSNTDYLEITPHLR